MCTLSAGQFLFSVSPTEEGGKGLHSLVQLKLRSYLNPSLASVSVWIQLFSPELAGSESSDTYLCFGCVTVVNELGLSPAVDHHLEPAAVNPHQIADLF